MKFSMKYLKFNKSPVYDNFQNDINHYMHISKDETIQ